MLSAIVFGVIAYVLGSVPWGLVIAKTFCHIDPRTAGSHNTGSTNVARLCGFGWGVATLACDILKGLLPVAVALGEGCSMVAASFVALCAVLGHVFSCFMDFKGGKAVATSIGVFLPLAFFPTLCSCLLCLFVIWRSGFVSAGSLSLVASLPIFLLFFSRAELLPLSICVLLVVALRHKENIARLYAGTEKSWMKSKQK